MDRPKLREEDAALLVGKLVGRMVLTSGLCPGHPPAVVLVGTAGL